MEPIELLRKELRRYKGHLKGFKAQGVSHDYYKQSERRLKEKIKKHERAVAHLEEMEKLDKYHSTLAVIQLLSLAYPKKKLPKGLEKLKYQPSEYERVETVKRILTRTWESLSEKRVRGYNKIQLESTLGRTRSEIGWLMDAFGL